MTTQEYLQRRLDFTEAALKKTLETLIKTTDGSVAKDYAQAYDAWGEAIKELNENLNDL